MANLSAYGHGKLLITGEYLVLDGADALAVPLRLGQKVDIKAARGADLHWKSLRPDGSIWFQGVFSMLDFTAQEASDPEMADRLTDILTAITRQNPDFLSDWKGQKVECQLEFEPEWGFGSSSTLIHALAEWGEVEPFTLYEQTFGGSGFDLACAMADGPIIYKNTPDEIHMTPVDLEWPFKDRLLVVYSGRKTSSREALEGYEAKRAGSGTVIQAITALTDRLVDTRDWDEFHSILTEHNRLMATWLREDPNPWAPDFPGTIKPLGAWGGDCFLAAGLGDAAESEAWFRSKGFNRIFRWSDLVLE